MTKKYNKGRKIYNVVEKNKPTQNVKLAETKVKPNAGNEYGSGFTNNKRNNNITNKRKKVPDIASVETDVLQYIVGQNKQVRQIITAIYRAINFKTIKSNILIIGNSGTGKTETISQIAKRLNIPYTIEDATKYTQEGYYGADVEEMVYNLIENANQDIKRAQNGIIAIDEIDKKAGHDEHDVSGTAVLKSLLKIIEGTKIKITQENFDEERIIDFDTKNNIVIFSGAFVGLEKIRNKRLNTNPLGFTTSQTIKKEQQSRFLKQDLIEYGMPEEFVGRIDTIVEMNKLTKQDLELILRKSKLSIFKKYQTELKKMGITLLYDKKIFEHIAEQSLAIDTGARELSNTVNYMFENIMYDIFANPNKYKKLALDLEIVKDNTSYKLF